MANREIIKVDDMLLEIQRDKGLVLPLIRKTNMCYVKFKSSDEIEFNYEDSIVFCKEDYKFMREIPLAKFIELTLPYIHSEFAKEYFNQKDEYLSKRISGYDELSMKEKIDLYDDKYLQFILRDYWNKGKLSDNKYFNYIIKSAYETMYEWGTSPKGDREVLSLYTPPFYEMTRDEYYVVKRRILLDRGDKAFEHFLPVLEELGMEFLNDNRKFIQTGYLGLVKAFDDEVTRDFKGRFDVNYKTLEDKGRFFASARNGVFYINDSKTPDYRYGVKEFLYKVLSSLEQAMLFGRDKDKLDYFYKEKLMKTVLSEQTRKEYAVQTLSMGFKEERFERDEVYFDTRNLTWDLTKVLELKKLYRQCHMKYKSDCRKEEVLNTKCSLYAMNLIEYLGRGYDLEDIQDIVNGMVLDCRLFNMDLEFFKSCLTKVAYKSTVNYVVDILFPSNEGKVDVSLAHIGE